VDLNSVTGPLLGVVHAFVIFCTKEEGYPLETNFSPAITDGLVIMDSKDTQQAV